MSVLSILYYLPFRFKNCPISSLNLNFVNYYRPKKKKKVTWCAHDHVTIKLKKKKKTCIMHDDFLTINRIEIIWTILKPHSSVIQN